MKLQTLLSVLLSVSILSGCGASSLKNKSHDGPAIDETQNCSAVVNTYKFESRELSAEETSDIGLWGRTAFTTEVKLPEGTHPTQIKSASLWIVDPEVAPGDVVTPVICLIDHRTCGTYEGPATTKIDLKTLFAGQDIAVTLIEHPTLRWAVPSEWKMRGALLQLEITLPGCPSN